MSRRIRQGGKTVSNRSILAEVRDRGTFVKQKKTKKVLSRDVTKNLQDDLKRLDFTL